jgi:ComEC/Rec2-related protein
MWELWRRFCGCWLRSRACPRKRAAAFIIPSLFFYAAVTGLHIPALRAAVMASILVGSYFFERRVFLQNSLAAAAFFILCWNTNELFSTGFQLSFAVVGAIVLFADPLFRLFPAARGSGSFSAAKPGARSTTMDALPPMNGFAVAHLCRLRRGSVHCR